MKLPAEYIIFCLADKRMQYRKFGKCDFEVSALGYGCMRFPVIDGNYGKINEKESIMLLRTAIDKGVNYVDTAYPYHEGNSEFLVGKALKDGYREKVKLATKMPVWLIKEYSDFDKYLNEQLEKLQTDYIDMYLLHALDKKRIAELEKIGVYKFLDAALKDGRIKYAGFSFHDDAETFKKIVDSYPWTFCQIQYNYLDTEYQAGKEGLLYAAEKGLAVIVMEPLKGGKLAVNLPENVMNVFDNMNHERTPADWALRWIWNYPEVTLLLSGMGTMEQLEQNINTAETAYADSLSEEELNAMETATAEFKRLIKVDCTSCEYCMPCPANIAIPRMFALYNNAYMHNEIESSSKTYNSVKERSNILSCIDCGQCEDACPQHISIREQLKNVHGALNRE